MMAPPNTFAPAAVSPSSRLVKMGDMRKKEYQEAMTAGLLSPDASVSLRRCRFARGKRIKLSSRSRNPQLFCKHTVELPARKMESVASYNSTWLEAES